MDRRISRRDFLHGAVGSVVAGAAVGAVGVGCEGGDAPRPGGPVGAAGVPGDPDVYPPARLGLRGSHPGAFEPAHEMAFARRSDWGAASEPDDAEYDLVVVGAGISGLAAAFFHRERHPGARVLLLENHDDFGGHAKRNEFARRGRTILAYGGSQSLEAPGDYSEVATGLLARIGVDAAGLQAAYDEGFYRRHGLAGGFFFDRATYGEDRFVRTDMIDPSAFLPVASAGTGHAEAIARMPISGAARRELTRLYDLSEDRLPDVSLLAEPDYLATLSYRDFLTRHAGVREPEVLALLQDAPAGYFGHGIDVIPALDAMLFGMPGLGATGLGIFEGALRKATPWLIEPYTFHFPDGNASVARLLVKHLIPAVTEAPARMDEMTTARLDYGALDRPDADVRLRLDSTVVNVAHEGDPATASRVAVTYVRGGRTERVRARHVVLACWNMVVPYICPELPAAQRQALAGLVKVPLVYTNVLLRSWRAVKDTGFGFAHCPGSWHTLAMVDFPVDLGDYRFTGSPDEPIVVHMSRVGTLPGLPPDEQSRAGRHALLGTPFDHIEREIRVHLGGLLGGGGFDPARDIAGIAVNRWPHGYAREPRTLFDPEYAPGEAPHEIGRRRFGRIAIANSDAGARAYLDEAIDQAWRAVGELSG